MMAGTILRDTTDNRRELTLVVIRQQVIQEQEASKSGVTLQHVFIKGFRASPGNNVRPG